MKEIRVKKGEVLQRTGELNSKIYKVEKGLLRSYSVDAKGKLHIFMFAPEGWIIADSVPPDQPTELFIDTLEDSILLMDNKKTEKNSAAKEFDFFKIIKRFYSLQTRIIKLLSSSAIERYEHFVDTYPDVVQRVPQKMIASYLGITPEALSKVKREQTKKFDKN